MVDSPLTRRTFLTAVGAAAGAGLVPAGAAQAAEASTASPTGGRAVTAAMHVHGSWSEGIGSWESQFAQASAIGVDLLCMTDHDHRALAYKYLPQLQNAEYHPIGAGSPARSDATKVGGGFHLLVEGGAGNSTAGLELQPHPQAQNRLRTNIGGTVLRHSWTSSRFDSGTFYEVTIGLSQHQGHGSRPAGQLALVYRFGDVAPGLSYERRTLTGIVSARPPADGAVTVLKPEDDIADLWPDLLALDNGFTSLSFSVTSRRQGAVAEVQVDSVGIDRNEADEASVIRNQQRVIDEYASRWPRLTVRPLVEISLQDPHVNVFGVPQFLPDPSQTGDDNFQRYYVAMVKQVHAQGGVVSYNHPFGANTGPLLSGAAQADRRRKLFAEMYGNDLYGTDILEVGYTLRGQVGIETHLALWDTFSRRARFLTGNGVNDDHQGKHWAGLRNGFGTGIWSRTMADKAVMQALRGGRAYGKDLGAWRDGELDMLVDGVVPMGKAAVSSKASRKLAVYVDGLPAGSAVELVQGVVDYRGNDPQTQLLDRLPASAFRGADKTAVRTVDTTSSSFVRAQVRSAGGAVIGFGNPVWLLREAPRTGIPGARKP